MSKTTTHTMTIEAHPMAPLLSPRDLVEIWSVGKCAAYRDVTKRTMLDWIKSNPHVRASFWRTGSEYRTTPHLQLMLDLKLAQETAASDRLP